MRAWPWVVGGVAVGVALYLVARRTAPVSAVETSVVEGVLDVYYATTQDSRENEQRYAPAIAEAESRHGLPSGLLHRLLYQESRFRTDIITGQTVSGAGAKGIAQIVPRWHPNVDPLNPEAAIDYAAAYLASLNRQFGRWGIALAAYNWGPGNVTKHLAQHGYLNLAALPKETSDYVTQIGNDVGLVA